MNTLLDGVSAYLVIATRLAARPHVGLVTGRRTRTRAFDEMDLLEACQSQAELKNGGELSWL